MSKVKKNVLFLKNFYNILRNKTYLTTKKEFIIQNKFFLFLFKNIKNIKNVLLLSICKKLIFNLIQIKPTTFTKLNQNKKKVQQKKS